MSDKQPEALRLADELAQPHQNDFYIVCDEAASELRCLHAENTDLRAQLEAVGAGGVSALIPGMKWNAERNALASLSQPAPAVVGPVAVLSASDVDEIEDALRSTGRHNRLAYALRSRLAAPKPHKIAETASDPTASWPEWMRRESRHATASFPSPKDPS